MVYGELRGIGIVERVYCSTTDNFFMAYEPIHYVHGSVRPGFKSRRKQQRHETGVFQTYSIAFSRFSNFHREF
jgi:hypothetical protein